MEGFMEGALSFYQKCMDKAFAPLTNATDQLSVGFGGDIPVFPVSLRGSAAPNTYVRGAASEVPHSRARTCALLRPAAQPFVGMGIVAMALVVQMVIGRWRFAWWPFDNLLVRVAMFAYAVHYFLNFKNECEAEFEKVQMGLAFTPVKGLVTTGPFAWSRNPIYIAFPSLLAAIAYLMDSLMLLLLTPLLPLYLDRCVIPKEEALLQRLYPDQFKVYAEKVPRWL
jgi:protein-S-isoprenylcysteine O-methyltransferase Ste14